MNNQRIVNKTMSIQKLQISHSKFDSSHFFDAGEGKENSSFGFVVKGEVTLRSLSENIFVPEGSLFYVPEGQRYHSVWTGLPDIEFYSVHIIWNRLNAESGDKLAMQYAPQLSNGETLNTFRTLFSLLGSAEYAEQIRGVALFYQWYSKAFPILKPQTEKNMPDALVAAMDFMKQNYSKSIDTADLAAHCCISVSRLYHLFQESLRITPVHYKNTYRVEKAAQLLECTDLEIEQIANDVGFNSSIYFREVFKQVTGMTPSSYRNAKKGSKKRKM